MSWITLAFGAAFSWGLYGASLHRGGLEPSWRLSGVP